MTQKAAICKALLDGKVLSIMNGFHLLNCTNIPREIGRSVERQFGVSVSRKERNNISTYGQNCHWVEYRLMHSPENADGIEKMKEYVNKQLFGINPKTDKQAKQFEKAGIISMPINNGKSQSTIFDLQ